MAFLTRRKKWFIFKLISLFSVVRVYNLLVIIIAQYLASIFILSGNTRALDVILDSKLFILILASSLVIASGYIINNFYDAEKDLINKPFKSKLDRIVSQKTKLNVYFILNFVVFFIAFFISWRAVIFFSAYIFLVWLYSHKLKKILFVGNFIAAILAILPFFAILLYYKNFYEVVFIHASYLFLLILIKEIIKDLQNIAGDLAQNYQTIPVFFGELIARRIVILLTCITLVPIYFLVNDYDIGYMDIYFYLSLLVLIYSSMKLIQSKTTKDYYFLHNLIKWIILVGVISIILIEPKVIINGKEIVF